MTYVAAHSNKSMPIAYKFAAVVGRSGRLAPVLVLAPRDLLRGRRVHESQEIPRHDALRRQRADGDDDVLPHPRTFVAHPFEVAAVGKGVTDLGDGQGLNPLLQYWTMVIHPPMLYLGYVGFVVPFAFAFASLVTKQPAKPGSYHAPLDRS